MRISKEMRMEPLLFTDENPIFLCRIHQARVAADKRNNVDSLLDHIQIVIVIVDPPRRFIYADNLAALRITYRKHCLLYTSPSPRD